MGTWLNSDGLYLKFGTDEATKSVAGEYKVFGGEHITEVVITATSLGTSSSILDDTVKIPAGATIRYVEVISDTAATSGGSAALNVGLIRTDRSTTYDADGLVAALALSTINAAGEYNKLVVGSTGAGALIGTELAYSGLLVADYDTAAFTAGKIRVRVGWQVV